MDADRSAPSSAAPAQPLLHITFARQDEAWVERALIPALGLADGQYWTRAEDDPGSPKLDELERAVLSCRYTLLVASSAASVDTWAQFTAGLAQHLGVEEGKPRLLLVTRDFAPGSDRARELLPLHQRCLACFDCSDADRTAAALAALAAQLALSTTAPPPAECPYPGLRPFGAGDPATCFPRTDLFFGRDAEARDVIDRLRDTRRVLLIGPSGCGKSSLIRARVLPALSQGAEAVPFVLARPGRQPADALRKALDQLDPHLGPAIDAYLAATEEPAARAALEAAGNRPRVLCVDQLEEVFLDPADESGQRARFFAQLVALGHVPGMALLLGMRADFYGDLMRSPSWDAFKNHRVELAPLRGAALRRVITRPAELAGVHVEADLVERLVREADQDRAAEALPLLQVALAQLWALREWRYLSLASYARLADGQRHGLDVVLARHADASIAALEPPAQVLARRVLIDLVHLGEGRPDTRRRRTASELRRAGDDDPRMSQVLGQLSADRLIAVGSEVSVIAAMQAVALPPGGGAHDLVERHVDLAHDALITGWPALAGWIAARRDDLRTQRRLEARAAGGGLLASSELPEFTRWVAWIDTPAGEALGATEALRALVQRSVAARKFQRRAFGIGLAIVISVLSVAAGVALWQRGIALDNAQQATANEARATANQGEADRQRDQANTEKRASQRSLARSYQETGRQLVLDDRPFEALAYLVEARKIAEQAGEPRAAGAPLQMLFAAAARHLPSLQLEHQGTVQNAAFSPDGTRIVTTSDDRTTRLWDARTGTPAVAPLLHPSSTDIASITSRPWITAPRSAAFSPDGTRLITAGEDVAQVWDVSTGKPRTPPLRHSHVVQSAAFSPDGTRIVTASADHTAQIWDASTGRPTTPPLPHAGPVQAAAFSPDGARVITASWDGTTRIWDANTGRPLAPIFHPGSRVLHAAFSADGTRVILEYESSSGSLWDAGSGQALFSPIPHLGSSAIMGVTFSPDGRRVVTAHLDDTVQIWNIASGQPVTPPLPQAGRAERIVFSAEGTRIVTRSNDTAQVWDTASGKPLTPPLKHPAELTTLAFSPDGSRLVTTTNDHIARVWEVTGAAPIRSLERPGLALAAVFVASQPRVLVSDHDTAQIWDVATGKALSPSLAQAGLVGNIAFSADGTRVLITSPDHAVTWDVATGRPLASFQDPLRGPPRTIFDPGATLAELSPDGARVITRTDDRTARVWDAATGQPLSPPLAHPGFVDSAAFSPDGARVITGGSDGNARIWHIASGRLLVPPLAHGGTVNSVAFSPDGARLVTTSDDRSARVWDADTGRPITPPLEHPYHLRTASFSPDGTRVIAAGLGDIAQIWDATTGTRLALPLENPGGARLARFSPDGLRVVTAGDRTVRIWDASTGKPLAAPIEHPGPVQSVAFNADGTRLVIAGGSTTQVCDLLLARGTLAEWSAVAERSPYFLDHGVLSRRTLRPFTAPPETIKALGLAIGQVGQALRAHDPRQMLAHQIEIVDLLASMSSGSLDHVRALVTLGAGYMLVTQWENAALVFRRALELGEHNARVDRTLMFQAMSQLGWMMLELGEPQEAITRLEAARAMVTDTLPPDRDDVTFLNRDLGRAYAAAGRHAEAVAILDPVVELLRKTNPTKLGDAYASLATALWAIGGKDNRDRARLLARQAQAALATKIAELSPDPLYAEVLPSLERKRQAVTRWITEHP